MPDYIERSAAVKAVEIVDFYKGTDMIPSGYASDAIRAIPAADVREVVLCRDCKHRDPEDHKCDSGQTERQGCPFPVDDDYFCAYGER